MKFFLDGLGSIEFRLFRHPFVRQGLGLDLELFYFGLEFFFSSLDFFIVLVLILECTELNLASEQNLLNLRYVTKTKTSAAVVIMLSLLLATAWMIDALLLYI